jgi:hypothetical protein
MNKLLRLLFSFILVFSIYHLIRDVLQTLDNHSNFTNLLHRPHQWCQPYCDYVTFPLDVFGIIGSSIVLKRNSLGIIGNVIIISQFLWILALLLP